mgnify:CR=1 FL=1
MIRQLLLPAVLALLLPTPTIAKVVQGDFKLSGLNSEKVLASFAVRPEHGAFFSLSLTATAMYETERFLKLRLYNDESWTRHLKHMTCNDKIRHAVHSIDITFDYIQEQWKLQTPINDYILTQRQKAKYDPRRLLQNQKKHVEEMEQKNKEAEDAEAHGGDISEKRRKAFEASADYVDDAFDGVDERDIIVKTKAFTATRPQYWYLAIDDCMLEQTNPEVPDIHFELEIVNALEPINKLPGKSIKHTQLSADESQLIRIHTFTLLVSGGIAFFLVMSAGLKATNMMHKKSGGGGGGGTIHAAVLWVALAAALDSFSSFCEILHLQSYSRNGVGSYFLDALAAHTEALCDSFLMLLLLSIGAGWTLPSDAIRARPNENAIQKAMGDLASPLRCLLRQPSSVVGILGWGTIALQAILCQWGRTYNDDFESYHDLEHLPGKIVMMVRIVLGVLLLAVTTRTYQQARVQQLQSFYQKLALLGCVWFESLPFVTWMCNTFVPYYMRHPAVFMWSALLQSSLILLLAWLVTEHSSAFAQYSHMSSASSAGGGSGVPPSLTESLSGAGGGSSSSTWSFGKTKIALD